MGIGPVSLAVAEGFLLVANRNEDPHQLDALRGQLHAFTIGTDGRLTQADRAELPETVNREQRHGMASSKRENVEW